jgi:hypothetical protein
MTKMKNTELHTHKVNNCTYLSTLSLIFCTISGKYTYKSNILVHVSLTSVHNNNVPVRNRQSLCIFFGLHLRVNLQSS